MGTPTWWYTMAPAVATLFGDRSWAGKTVVPFATNAGWPGSALRDMEDACAPATIACPLEVRFDSNGGGKLMTPKRDIAAWADRLHALAGK